jgi:hypothetical protein
MIGHSFELRQSSQQHPIAKEPKKCAANQSLPDESGFEAKEL